MSDVCVFFVLCGVVSGLILWFWDLWFDDLRAEYTGGRLNIVLGPDVILCG